jgi:quinol monooxygenase YgiN
LTKEAQMYGRVARLRIKPGMDAQLLALSRDAQGLASPGGVAGSLYRMDADPAEYYLTVVWESKESYVANANSPEQHAFYLRYREVLAEEPEWHDGAIVYHDSRTSTT